MTRSVSQSVDLEQPMTPGRSIATAVSGPGPGATRRCARPAEKAQLGGALEVARGSQRLGVRRRRSFLLASIPLMFAASCIITTDPQFEPPEQLGPFFLPDRAIPDAREVRVIEATDSLITFSGFVQSEDVGQPLVSRLYVNYGSPFEGDVRLYQRNIVEKELAVGTWDEGGRLVESNWTRNDWNTPGCHRFTLMVARDFKEDGCPKVDGEYATLTWTVLICDPDLGCPVIDPPDSVCPPITSTCPPPAVVEPN